MHGEGKGGHRVSEMSIKSRKIAAIERKIRGAMSDEQENYWRDQLENAKRTKGRQPEKGGGIQDAPKGNGIHHPDRTD